jgi:hypothetical protein
LSRPTSGREGDAPCGFLTFRFRDGPSAVVISSVFDNPFDVSRGEISDVANFDVSYTGAWFGRRMNTLWFDADVGALENLSFASPRLIRVNSRFPEPIGRYAQIAGGGYEPVRDEGEQASEDRDKPIWSVIQKGLIPLAFLMSFGALFVCERISTRAAGRAVLAFGLGWTLLVVFYGLL